ncbi:MAG: PIG-L family deacetylase [Anaerolineales bacterium]|nr:PIG-L family deacetylase [Anaerolineales bacterium]
MCNVEVKPVLLAVLAHPDDETFGMGGTLALYARRGVDVHLVCATRGEAGEMPPELLAGFESIADRREHELRCAAGILGLAGVHFLDYRDSGMPGSPDNHHPSALAAAPVEEVAGRVAHYIRLLQPQVLLTFDPIGGYKHPDHIAIHRATVEAFRLASDPDFPDGLPPHQPGKLYYHVIPKGLLRLAVRLLPLFGQDSRRFGRNGDIDLKALVEEGDFPVHARIDFRAAASERAAAVACHASQLGGGAPQRGPVGWLMRWFGRKEQFMRAYPPPEPGLRERDLFEGV